MSIASQTDRTPFTRTDWLVATSPAAGLFALTAILFWLHAVNPDWGSFQGDLRAHIFWAEQAYAGERGWFVSRPLLQLLIVGVAQLPGIGFTGAAVIVLATAVAAGYAVTLVILRRYADPRWPLWALVAISVAASVAAGVYAPMIHDRLYARIGTPNVWHNPTQVLLVPLALAGFFAAERWLREQSRPLWWSATGLLVATTLVKPNYALAFIPALGLYVVICDRHRIAGAIGMVTPTIVVLAAQYVLVFGNPPVTGSEAGIALGMISDPGFRLVLAVLALGFAFAVLGAAPRPLPRGLLLAWLLVAIAFAQRMFLIETGSRAPAGNWHWGYFIALKVVLTYSAVALLHARPLSIRSALTWGVLLLQLFSGSLYLHRLFTGSGFLG